MEIFANIYLNVSEFMSVPHNDNNRKKYQKQHKKKNCWKDAVLCVCVCVCVCFF